MKTYIIDERDRNLKWRGLYETLLKRVYGEQIVVMITHHIQAKVDDRTVVEIPSADTLLFCPEFMGKVFGPSASLFMQILALTPTEEREVRVSDWLNDYRPGREA